MTREEAIRQLKEYILGMNYMDDEAVNLAVKALEQQPCEDCISREATIDAIYKKYIGGKDAIKNASINDLYADGLAEAVDAVWEMPPVTPTRPTARWERLVEDYNKCSKCGEMGKLYRIYKYCPNCGARMTESEDKE